MDIKEWTKRGHADATNAYMQSEARSRFWIITAAIKAFYEKHQRLPVTGIVPDMKAESGVYVRLQQIYKDQAQRDANEVMEIARATAVTNGVGNDDNPVDMEEVEMFCKNASFAKLINAGDRDPNLLQKVVGKLLMFFLPLYLPALPVRPWLCYHLPCGLSLLAGF